MRLVFSDEVLLKSALGGSPCKLGKAQSLHSEATQRSLPVVRPTCVFLRVRVDDEGLEVKSGQRDSQSDVNPVYYVFGHLWYFHDATTFMQELCCYYVLSLFATVLLLCENLFSRVTS